MREAPDLDYVLTRIFEAGTTLLCMPAAGIHPAGYGSGWPAEVVQLLEYWGQWNDLENAQKFPRPSPGAIQRMEQVLFDWLLLIPDTTDRKIVGLRMMVHPLTDRHLFSWRKIGRRLGMSKDAAKTRCGDAIFRLSYTLHYRPYSAAAKKS